MAVFNGQACEFLLRAPFNDCSLPLARTLMFSFRLWQLEYAKRVLDALDPAEVQANIRAFVGRVKQMAPRASEIRLELVMELAEPPNIVKKYFGSLATQLYQFVDRVELRSYSALVRMELQLHKVRDLVHIKSRDYDEALASLVRQNAPTLQSLNIRICRSGNIARVIRDESSVYVQYPQLLVLKLDTFSIPENMTEQVFPGAMPFLKLRHIAVDGQYPLGDEAIFRGNAATLEYLSLMISLEKLVLFRERRVFTPTSHPNLRYVRIFQPADVTPSNLNILAANMDFVLGIGPNAVLREVTNIPYRAGIPRMPSLDRNRSCLQYLLLYGTRLDLAQVIMLMINLPVLTDLHCGSDGLGPYLAKHPSDVLSTFTHSPLLVTGRRFRCWHLDDSRACSETEVVLCVLYLALACPKFNHVAPNRNNDDSFKREMDQMIDSDWCKPYAPRLRRVTFSSDI
ncbi:hypothetical protein GGI17_000931 [Coemansia sp. S146]|nr:hypothetical protein GGI17_000931 [Coemansia sp. S146]